jgi:cytochrome c oxidase subunit 2
MLLAPVVWLLTIAICILFMGKFYWFPPPINAHGEAYDQQFTMTLIVTGVIFFVAQMALGYVIFRYKSSGQRVEYSHGNNKLEALWTSAAAVLFVGLVLMGTKIWAGVHFEKAPPDAVEVQVLAKQFAWAFRYAGPDGKYGRTDIKFINDANGNPFGIDESDPAGKDDIVNAALKVPVGKPILLVMRSRDVIHNFFVRELRMKQDLVPGMEIPFHFRTEKTGTFEIPCSELCGLGHSQMRSTMEDMSEADFEKWKKDQLAQK